jgi:hypothetical protein
MSFAQAAFSPDVRRTMYTPGASDAVETEDCRSETRPVRTRRPEGAKTERKEGCGKRAETRRAEPARQGLGKTERDEG